MGDLIISGAPGNSRNVERAAVCFDQKKSQFGSNSLDLFKMILWIFLTAAEDASIK